MKAIMKYVACFVSGLIVAMFFLYLFNNEIDFSGAFIGALGATVGLYAASKSLKAKRESN